VIGSHVSPVLSYPLQRTLYRVVFTLSSSKNPQKFQQSVRESIELNHVSVTEIIFAAFQTESKYDVTVRRKSTDSPSVYSQVKVGSFCFRAPVGRTGGFLFTTDCVRRCRWICRKASFFTLFFFGGPHKVLAWEVTVESGGKFEDYIRFLSCHVFGPVNHGQNWKGWQWSGEKAWLSADNQGFHHVSPKFPIHPTIHRTKNLTE